jgi:hypothetical protein
LSHNIAWGNAVDVKIKTGTTYYHESDHLVALRPDIQHDLHCTHCLLGTRYASEYGSDTIVLFDEPDDLDLNAEFADPVHFDYRLQATSRFRGAADDGSDRGAYPFEGNIFYVAPDGDDSDDGLSVENAFKTIGHAVDQLGPGQTLYILPGIYDEDVELTLEGDDDHRIFIKGRGMGAAVIDGRVTVRDSSHVTFERINFRGAVTVGNSDAVSFANDRLLGEAVALDVTDVRGLRVTHSTFTGFQEAAIASEGSNGLFLANNLYDNAHGVAVRLDRGDALTYSNYNSYSSVGRAFQIDDGLCSVAQAGGHVGEQSQRLVPEFVEEAGVAKLQNPELFSAGGFDARPFGTYRDRIPTQELQLNKELYVHSVSSTTANLEWMTNYPAAAEFAWGPTRELENQGSLQANRFASLSLTGLEPDTTYYIALKSLRIPDEVEIKAEPIEVNDPMISFTTLAEDEEPTTYYVAADGDDQNAGTGWNSAFETIQKAADVVNVGDTVIIGEGVYTERVRIRATGTEDKPIVFRAAAGQQVVINGDQQRLNQAIAVGSKNYLTFDGFQFRAFNFAPGGSGDWKPGMGSEFNLNQSDHITISRCLSDGRSSSSTARTLVAFHSSYLHMSNCVSVFKMSNAIYLNNSHHARFEHNVFYIPMIRVALVRGSNDATFENNIFTDPLEKKVLPNHSFFYVDGGSQGLKVRDNTFYLRDIFSPSERHIVGERTAAEASSVSDAFFADPVFQLGLDLEAQGEGPYDFWPDRGKWDDIDYDFEKFMATNPEVISRDHGLEPDQFVDGLPN